MEGWTYSEPDSQTFKLPTISSQQLSVATEERHESKSNFKDEGKKKSKKKKNKFELNLRKRQKKTKKDEKTEKEKRCGCARRTYLGLRWQKFGQTATLHGMKYVTNPSTGIFRRCFWIIFLLVSISVLLQGIIDNLTKFFNYPVSSLVTLQYVDNVTFPAVTVCNYNQWRRSNLTEDQMAILTLVYPTLHVPNESIAWSEYNFTEGRNFTKEIMNAAHQKEDMIMECSWQMMDPCGPENFTQVFTDFGVCYTFNNPPRQEDALSVRQTGFDYGLFLRLNVEQWEYYNSLNTGAGIKVINLPKPYINKCLQESDEKKYTDYHYTVELCETLCEANYIVETCGCKKFNMPGKMVNFLDKTYVQRNVG
ncbi:Acid-sensing ion channel 1A [Holothuria leucospilota]|uniref:Acid-sensing ion channel 1A n=1 Tax=Holothuria leucospilota TaxID=206669 RepID=A0A9Q1BKS2_HOLLE|nr:Acid-sensing ion channel 1A [Holothuria leucospilota]